VRIAAAASDLRLVRREQAKRIERREPTSTGRPSASQAVALVRRNPIARRLRGTSGDAVEPRPAPGRRTSRQVSGPFATTADSPRADPDAAGDHGVYFAGRRSRDHVCTLAPVRHHDVIQLGPLTR
jgi:hypothetical protein